MARSCSVCAHLESFTINEELIVGGVSVRDIARRYGVSKDAVQRHKQHIPDLLVKARDHAERGDVEALVDRLEELARETRAILRETRSGDDKDNELALKAIARLEKQLELEAKILEIIKTAPVINLVSNPQWIELRAVILTALEEHPDARGSVLSAIEGVSNGSGY
jgi:AcrR family transcriptional regulator